MYYCKKCKKEVKTKQDLYKGLCKECYFEYLSEKVKRLGTSEYFLEDKKIFSIKQFFKKIFENIKNWKNKK